MHAHEPVHRLPRRHSGLADRRVVDELSLIGPPRPERPTVLMPLRLRAAVIDAHSQVNRDPGRGAHPTPLNAPSSAPLQAPTRPETRSVGNSPETSAMQ